MADIYKIKITDHQLTTITFGFVFGYTSITTSSFTMALAGRDAWISVIVAVLLGALIIWFQTYLGGLYPDKTYVEIIRDLLGKWLGGFINANFILLCLIGTAQIVWYVGDFFTTQFMPETPSYAINTLFVTVVVIALLYGLEAITRAFEIFIYLILPLFALSMLLLIPNIKVDYLLPVFEKGITPILKGSLPLLEFAVIPVILLNMIYPVNVKDIKKAKKAIFKGYLTGMLLSFVLTIMCGLVLGSDITANSRFTVFLLTKEINLANIFSRMEALIVIVWLLAIFNSTIFYFYPVVLGLSQLLKLKDHKIIILPLGLIITVLSGFIYTNVPYEISWDSIVWFPYISTFGIVTPVVLLIIHIIRKRK
jgi:spore germination protein (amino acid permease)